MSSIEERYQYIYGNTVRTVREPAENPKMPEPKQPKKPKRRHKVREFNSRFTGSLFLAVTVLVVACCFYLHGQSQLNRQMHDISSKKVKLASLKNENHEKRSLLNKSVDYDAIKRYASDKLGMVVPGEDNTIYYDGAAPDYVRQYEEIPEAQ